MFNLTQPHHPHWGTQAGGVSTIWNIASQCNMEKGLGNPILVPEISPEYSLEGLMLKLKLQYFGHLMRRTGKDWRQEKGTTEDEMVGWHHQLNGHDFEQALGVGDGQGSLACCSPWGHKELDTAEWLNWTYLGSNRLLPRKDRHHFCSLSIGQVKSCTYV